MSYVTILWSAAAAVALLLALVHGLVWLHDRRARANLVFVAAGAALAVAAITELGMLHAASLREWGEWLWWMHPPIFVLASAIAVFLRLYLRAGRLWLLTAVIATRGLVLLLDLLSEPSLNLQRIDSIAQQPLLGEQVSVVASAVTGEYQWLALLASLLLPLFILDVVVTVWRRRTPAARRMALLVGAPMLAAVVLSIVSTQMVMWRVVDLPMLLVPPFLIALCAMAIELSRDISRDVTRQRRAEDEANDLRYQLAHAGRVSMLGQLSSALAHELNQPLSAIQQNAEAARLLLAREPVDTQELSAIIADVLRDDQRAAQVLYRLRTWLKQGRMRLEGVVLHELTEDVIELVRPAAVAKHVSLECIVPRTLPSVFGDRVHLSQVLLNLIMNGIDAVLDSCDTHRRVLIEACVAANHCCEISVTDTGPGIPPGQLDRIFEPFVTAKTEGMGIGLSISRTIVEAHGGRLWAENTARGGATFRFTVPMQQAAGVACSA